MKPLSIISASIFLWSNLAQVVSAQMVVSPRQVHDSRQFSLSCAERSIVIDRYGNKSGATGETKTCFATIVAPAGYALALTNQEFRNVPKGSNNNMFVIKPESVFRYGDTQCDRGYGWSPNCSMPASGWTRFLPITRPYYGYAFSVPLSCNTSGSSGKTPAIVGGVTVTYSLITEAEAVKNYRLAPRPAKPSSTPSPSC